MEKQTLVLALNFLRQAYPRIEFNPATMWELLNDLDDRDFVIAVKTLCQENTEIFPGTPVIGILRERTNEFFRERIKQERKKKERESPKQLEECAPPPPEWTELLNHLKQGKGAQ